MPQLQERLKTKFVELVKRFKGEATSEVLAIRTDTAALSTALTRPRQHSWQRHKHEGKTSAQKTNVVIVEARRIPK